MAKITAAEVRRLAELCHLRLTEDEVLTMQEDLSKILSYVEVLQKVDVSGLEPTSQVTGLTNVMRADEEMDYKTTPEELLKNAPSQKNHQFKVKRIL
ncbi:Asp-tRNA(Asn)/Glu-tRNA(Gln) amidotransferase subunit GatC [Candidatus Saccharibacteria bacterium]|nr:Asp-tRNA(Asn)/Glu-tRNA(Gln) amidotransferase subunit GatC [Candidatus Saccharibacteria bacterium]HPW47990.1 Asp-tRNA(Asn)/Glu-tRNA(Gln) amidotransferase subunit GatC [Candidatus Saccharibacteria bacterium]